MWCKRIKQKVIVTQRIRVARKSRVKVYWEEGNEGIEV